MIANYATLMKFFEELIEDKEVDSSVVAKASGFLHNMESFEFVFLLTAMIEIFDRIEILNKDLQKSELCVVESYRKVEIVAVVILEIGNTKLFGRNLVNLLPNWNSKIRNCQENVKSQNDLNIIIQKIIILNLQKITTKKYFARFSIK